MTQSRRKLPPLNALRAFEVAGRLLSFRAAAEELGVTQGAVGQQVRILEQSLGIVLFNRLARGLSLTATGAVYLVDITRALDTMATATGKLRIRANLVTISVTPTVAARILIPRLGEFRQHLPGIELRTVATEALADFDRDEADIAIRLCRTPIDADLQVRVLFRQETVAVASPCLVKGLKLPLDGVQLRALPLLHDALGQWSAFLEVPSVLPGTIFNHTTLALDAAMAGQGVALACRSFVATDLKAGRLLQVSNKILHVSPDYLLVRKRCITPKAAVDSAWDWCARVLSSP